MKRSRQRPDLPAVLRKMRPFRWLVFAAVIMAAAGAILWYSMLLLQQLDLFRIRELVVRQGDQGVRIDNSGDFSYLLGRNIFSVDLKAEACRVERQYPSYKKIRLIRFMPDKIFVDLLKRQPVASVRAPEPLFIDEAMVLFAAKQAAAGVAARQENIPEITGIERTAVRVRPGTVCDIPEISTALQIIKQAQLQPGLKNFTIRRIDVASLGNTSIFLLEQSRIWDYTKVLRLQGQEMLEVKIGQDDIAQKMDLLETMLTQVKNNLGSIKYIDLRFKEPVIRFKERT